MGIVCYCSKSCPTFKILKHFICPWKVSLLYFSDYSVKELCWWSFKDSSRFKWIVSTIANVGTTQKPDSEVLRSLFSTFHVWTGARMMEMNHLGLSKWFSDAVLSNYLLAISTFSVIFMDSTYPLHTFVKIEKWVSSSRGAQHHATAFMLSYSVPLYHCKTVQLYVTFLYSHLNFEFFRFFLLKFTPPPPKFSQLWQKVDSIIIMGWIGVCIF